MASSTRTPIDFVKAELLHDLNVQPVESAISSRLQPEVAIEQLANELKNISIIVAYCQRAFTDNFALTVAIRRLTLDADVFDEVQLAEQKPETVKIDDDAGPRRLYNALMLRMIAQAHPTFLSLVPVANLNKLMLQELKWSNTNGWVENGLPEAEITLKLRSFKPFKGEQVELQEDIRQHFNCRERRPRKPRATVASAAKEQQAEDAGSFLSKLHQNIQVAAELKN